jgi:hypothetical protein
MGTPPWITALGVVGTWLIFVAAIWGERIRSWLFRPQLRVALENAHGERTIETIFKAAVEPGYTRPARYYRLLATNARRA